MAFATPFRDRPEAVRFAKGVAALLNGISSNRERITPKHLVFRRSSAVDILKLLPKTNCGECGFRTCLAFAATLGQQETRPDRCPHMVSAVGQQIIYPVYGKDGSVRSTVTIGIDPFLDAPAGPSAIPTPERSGGRPLRRSDGQHEQSAVQPLTRREREVLRLVAGGATNAEISERLAISPHTVKSHVINIFNKLSVSDRTEAAVWATRHNLI